MKLIVLGKAEFEVSDEASPKENKIFLMQQGFTDIDNYHSENKERTGYQFDICTANYCGRKKEFKKPSFDCGYYGEWVRRAGLGHAQLLELNANELNDLCLRDGKER